MGDLFDFRNGLSKGKEFFGTGTPFIRYTDVYNNRFLKAENVTALVECTPAELEKLRVSRGDVLFTRTSETAEDVGWSSVMLDDIGDCVFNGFCIKATPKTSHLLPETPCGGFQTVLRTDHSPVHRCFSAWERNAETPAGPNHSLSRPPCWNTATEYGHLRRHNSSGQTTIHPESEPQQWLPVPKKQ